MRSRFQVRLRAPATLNRIGPGAASNNAGPIVISPTPRRPFRRSAARSRGLALQREMDLADASLHWLAFESEVTSILTTDVADFSRYRRPDGRPFALLE